MSDAGYDGPIRLPQRTYRALAETDTLPAALRQCVHEYGHAIVRACLAAGVTAPNQIHNLVHEIWQGARQPQQRTGSTKRADRSPVMDKVDWILIQAGSQISAEMLVRVLSRGGFSIVPTEPSPQMVEASMDAVNHFGVVSKTIKHRNRLRAAINVGSAHLRGRA